MNPLVCVEDIEKTYGSIVALAPCSLTLLPGQHTALTGPSGCGKSTLLRLISGLEAPDRGLISIAGRIVTDGPRILIPPHERGLSMVFQDLALWPDLTASENVSLGLAAAGLTKTEVRSRTREAMEFCRIATQANRLPAQLSGGQQQRVALGRALSIRPRLLLLDEPFTGLDSTLKGDFITDLLTLVAGYGITLLAATHDMTEAAAMRCRVADLAAGQSISAVD